MSGTDIQNDNARTYVGDFGMKPLEILDDQVFSHHPLSVCFVMIPGCGPNLASTRVIFLFTTYKGSLSPLQVIRPKAENGVSSVGCDLNFTLSFAFSFRFLREASSSHQHVSSRLNTSSGG
jgi:hypothetical protein